MKLTKHAVSPPPPPPATFDLTGLTEADVRVLRAALGMASWGELRRRGCTQSSVATLSDTLAQTGVKYALEDDPNRMLL